jgi:glycosyltransferase involved in cell wall biosynthesis
MKAGQSPTDFPHEVDIRSNRVRIVALAAGPVIYQSPLYRAVAADPRAELRVIFASNAGMRPYDAGFGGRLVTWDGDLVAGYAHEFLAAAEQNETGAGFMNLRDWDAVHRLRSRDYDVLWVHGYTYLTLLLGILTARVTRRPVLLREEQTLLERRPRVKGVIRSLILRLLLRRTYALAIGSNNRDFFQHHGVPSERIFDVPYCVDNARLQARARELAPHAIELRRGFGIADGTGPVFLFVGKLVPKKRPIDVLAAFERVRAEHPCSLLFVGDGPLIGELEARASGVPDVHFAGFLNRDELPDAFAAADALVLPSSGHETWGIVVNEAMNFALPLVVSAQVGSARDLVHNGENGFVVPAFDVGALARAMDELAGDQALRRRMGERSLELIARWRYDLAADGLVDAALAAHGSRTAR